MATAVETSTIRRVYWRVIPLFFLAMFFNYLDRINIGFASLRMNGDLGFSPAVFGFGASIFFFGYMLLEVPSNIMLYRLGARLWLARILLSWGLIAALMAFVWSDTSFYALRLLLGIAEAGFLPGLALYLTLWFPAAYRARAVAGYIIAGQIAAVVGGPLSTMLMTYGDGLGGLHGWQWMFIIEGVPTMVLGVVFLLVLTDRPEDARWLTPEQRQWLTQQLASERSAIRQDPHTGFAQVVRSGRVWALAALFGCALVGIYGLLIWMPQIISAIGGLSDIQVGLLSAVPPLLGVIATVVVSRSSDRTGDRKFHLAAVYGIGFLGLAGSALTGNATAGYLLLCLAGLGLNSGNALFWSLNASIMTGAAAATSIAFVNTVAQFGGLIGPWMIGFVRSSTGSFTLALLTIAGFLLLAAVIAALYPAPRTAPEHAPAGDRPAPV
ncbi:MFS transporter [Roseomonas elaeocarpi]|uniref:MFS transporter n=1 Tax=Roseomonas elaeocarpi TaxID=907779 RepID=A0ABV6JVE7_9PROT